METDLEEKYKYLISSEDSDRRERDRHKQLEIEAEQRYNNRMSTVTEYCFGYNAFLSGAKWADANPSVDTLLKFFFILEEKGIIKEDLCFDPEHYIESNLIPLYLKRYGK